MVDFGVNATAVQDIVARAARLDARDAAALADAVDWRWWPLTVPPGGAIAGAWATARATAHHTGRDGAVAASSSSALEALRASPGYRAASRRGPWANAGLALASVGLALAILVWFLSLAGWILIGLGLALLGLIVWLFAAGGPGRAARISRGVQGAILAAALQDVLDPDAYTILSGPWRTALHD